jgi:plastocyanin
MRALLFAIALLAAAGPAAAAERRVLIKDGEFDPAVATVPPGTEVVWRNDTSGVHTIEGDFGRSGDIAPGREFRETFRRLGTYVYRDGRRPDVEGTIVVAAAVRRPPRPPGGGGRIVEHLYRGSITVEMRENAVFWDPLHNSRRSACNAQVGTTAQTASWTANLRGLEYQRAGSIEILSSGPSPARLRTYVENVDAKIGDAVNGPFTPRCENGSENEAAPVHDVKCTRNLSGKAMRIVVGWGPRSTRNRFQWSNDGPDLTPDAQCGESHVNTGTLAGIGAFGLPVNFVGDEVITDTGNLSPATPSEVRALRAGRGLTVRRRMELHYTTDCCAGFNNRTTPPIGVFVRAAEIRDVKATVTIRLRPR